MLRARYGWQNSGSASVVRVHQWADTFACARPAGVESLPEGAGVSIGYAGLAEGRRHVLQFLEQRRGVPARQREVRTSWADLAAGRAMPDCDLLAVGCLPRHAPALRGAGGLLMPLRINLVVPVDGEPGSAALRVSRKARQQYAREARALDRGLECGDGQPDFDYFFDRMHVPTMASRHGSASRSVARATALACIYRRGVLFFLTQAGERVAGMLCRIEGQTLVIRLAGVLDGGTAAYQHGTYMALYIEIIDWAASRGLRRVDLSGCEPFLSKGIFQFKRKLHPQVGVPDNHFNGKVLWLYPRRDTPDLRDFLVANPAVVTVSGGGLEAVYFSDAARPARTDLRWECPGISGFRLVDLDAFFRGPGDRVDLGGRLCAG